MPYSNKMRFYMRFGILTESDLSRLRYPVLAISDTGIRDGLFNSPDNYRSWFLMPNGYLDTWYIDRTNGVFL